MNILSVVIIIFVVLEMSNVFMLYFIPSTKRGNGLGVFNAYEKSKDHPEIHALIKYLINWIAGTKLIFIALLIVILCTGNNTTKIYCAAALVLSILTFFWRLYPAIKKMDNADQITPKGYSNTLAIMIISFIAMFMLALVLYLVYLK